MTKIVAALLTWLSIWALSNGAAASSEPQEDSRLAIDAETASAVRDPFAPKVSDLAEGRGANPLEHFAIGELKLVATIGGIEPPRALIEDPNGLGFIVTPGTVVGAERRRIVSIADGRIVLDGSPFDGDGARQIVTFAGHGRKQERR